MVKFKKGDRVKIKYLSSSDILFKFKVGDIGTVDENDTMIPVVIFDDREGNFIMTQDQLELVDTVDTVDPKQLLRDALKVLNMVPNKVYNGTDFESYQLAGRIQDYLE